jgi:hypothetical protein
VADEAIRIGGKKGVTAGDERGILFFAIKSTFCRCGFESFCSDQ